MSTEQPAVTIIGSGIAGSALAAALANAGVPVFVLERTEQFVDHVRGEYMHPWGVAEAMQLGLHGDLIEAGGNVISRFVGYDEAYAPVWIAVLEQTVAMVNCEGVDSVGEEPEDEATLRIQIESSASLIAAPPSEQLAQKASRKKQRAVDLNELIGTE